MTCSARVEPHGEDHVGLRRHVEESEVGRHDADDLRRLRIDRELTPERRFVAAESPLPERMRENDGRRAPRPRARARLP